MKFIMSIILNISGIILGMSVLCFVEELSVLSLIVFLTVIIANMVCLVINFSVHKKPTGQLIAHHRTQHEQRKRIRIDYVKKPQEEWVDISDEMKDIIKK